jgi:uncharacterized protein YndB with AHSA1/START domain
MVAAPVEEVWKVLHDPSRFPEWWAGVETVALDGDTGYTMWPIGYPDFPMPQRINTVSTDRRVTISCLVSDLEYVWRMAAVGESTRVEVEVTIPPVEAGRLEVQQRVIAESLDRLAALASDV